ncbi:MAG: glycosyltransferase [Dysgonamonadaceae bacterium]|jgi:glycosyltransferase involved in cell wall biosynthesis|nr:glycosyltransferase [Dysgonamonadaceae bacterium]
MIKVSLIVPVYNVAKYLPACMDSIVSQTLQDIEVICINDGSTDNCAEILEQYARKDARIAVITQANKGISNARNKGIARAKGEYIGFLDSDDVIAPDFLEKLYVAATKHDADVAMTNIRRFLFGRYKLRFREEKVYTEVQSKIDGANIPRCNYVWNKIYRKSALKYPFTEGIYYEDMNWTIKVIYDANKVVSVPDTAYYYRKIPQSIVQSRSERKEEDCRLAWSELLAFAKEHRIRFKEAYYMKQKTKTTIFGITILKGYHWSYRSRYKLFGIIPFMTIERMG